MIAATVSSDSVCKCTLAAQMHFSCSLEASGARRNFCLVWCKAGRVSVTNNARTQSHCELATGRNHNARVEFTLGSIPGVSCLSFSVGTYLTLTRTTTLLSGNLSPRRPCSWSRVSIAFQTSPIRRQVAVRVGVGVGSDELFKRRHVHAILRNATIRQQKQ